MIGGVGHWGKGSSDTTYMIDESYAGTWSPDHCGIDDYFRAGSKEELGVRNIYCRCSEV